MVFGFPDIGSSTGAILADITANVAFLLGLLFLEKVEETSKDLGAQLGQARKVAR